MIRVALLLPLILAGCQLAGSWLNPTPPQYVELNDPQIGVSYAFAVHTHCGLDDATIDGETWLFEGEPQGNPPAGFMNPMDGGHIFLLDADNAVFTSSGGVEMRLTRGGTPRVVGCI